jgi:DNA repair exonuclease SbcCD ATPase subunit
MEKGWCFQANVDRLGFTTILSDPAKVNAGMEKMLGISPDIIEKTVYVRQKEVDELSRADAIELRALIANFFDLDEFNRVKDELSDRSTNLQSSISTLRESIGHLTLEKNELTIKQDEMNDCGKKSPKELRIENRMD